MYERLLKAFPKDQVALSASPGSAKRVPHGLQKFWDEGGSGYFGGLALHVFGVGYLEAFHDIDLWNERALAAYRWLVPTRYVAFAEDAFGTQFFYDEGIERSPVYALLLQDAVMFTVAESIEAFFSRLLQEKLCDAILNYSFYIDCLTNGIDHQVSRHLTLKVPRCLGGNEQMGMIDVDAQTNVAYLGQLLRHAQGLTPDELAVRIRFKFE